VAPTVSASVMMSALARLFVNLIWIVVLFATVA
jgi:hypothetical protein